MAKDYAKVLLITANVGSIFEDVSVQFLKCTSRRIQIQDPLVWSKINSACDILQSTSFTSKLGFCCV